MKRVALAIAGTVTSLVLLLSFKAHSPMAVATPPAAVSSTGSSASTPSQAASKSASSRTYTGTAAETRYGPVQVQITVKSGTITSVAAVDYPTNNPRDAQINAYAIPALNSEAKSANSANIDMVSGATYTSQGYLSSLQNAIDQAGL